MGFKFDKWEQNPLRAIFKDDAGNVLSASAVSVKTVIDEGARKTALHGENFKDYMQPSYLAAKTAMQHLKV